MGPIHAREDNESQTHKPSPSKRSSLSQQQRAGLLAKNAIEKGLSTKGWVKTSLAPGSRVVENYLKKADLLDSLNHLGFNIVGYGCTTCIGNSGPLDEKYVKEIKQDDNHDPKAKGKEKQPG